MSARNYIMTRAFEMVSLRSDMRADTAMERGAALALKGQLIDARREIAGLQRQVLVASDPLGWRDCRRPGGGYRCGSSCGSGWAWRQGRDGHCGDGSSWFQSCWWHQVCRCSRLGRDVRN
ncbi:hypothetical protein MRX96_044106 [Rhipicephalus microplus]